MNAIINGVLDWFAREYFEEFSGGDALSLAILVLFVYVLTQRPGIRTKDVLALKGDVNQIKGQMQTLVAMLKPVPPGNAPSPPSHAKSDGRKGLGQ